MVDAGVKLPDHDVDEATIGGSNGDNSGGVGGGGSPKGLTVAGLRALLAQVKTASSQSERAGMTTKRMIERIIRPGSSLFNNILTVD
jgi:hypothetical protein